MYSLVSLWQIYHDFWSDSTFLLPANHAKSRDYRFPAKNRAKTARPRPLVVLGGNYTKKHKKKKLKKIEWKRYEIKNFKFIYLWIFKKMQ